jgi:hypothetical protein
MKYLLLAHLRSVPAKPSEVESRAGASSAPTTLYAQQKIAEIAADDSNFLP